MEQIIIPTVDPKKTFKVKKVHREYVKLLNEYEERASIHRNMQQIAAQPLPPHKQKKINDAVTRAYVKVFNLSQKLEPMYRKFNPEDQQIVYLLKEGELK